MYMYDSSYWSSLLIAAEMRLEFISHLSDNEAYKVIDIHRSNFYDDVSVLFQEDERYYPLRQQESSRLW